MARPSKMWFRKDRGSYYVRIDGRLHNLGRDKDAAKTAFHELMASRPQPVVTGQVTAATVMDKFLVWTKENRASSTYDKHGRHLQAFLDSLPDQTIAATAIKPHHVESWVSGNGWADGYKRTMMSCVIRAINWGVKQGYLDRSPLHGLEQPPSQRRENIPTIDEYDEMLKHAKGEFADALTFCFETGCRPQEMRKMRGRHFLGGKIQFAVKESKGKKRSRVIYLNAKAKEIVERRLNDDFIFTNRNGSQWTKDAINCGMRRIAKKTGKHFAMYSLRHLWATRMLEGGMDHITAAKLLGHVDATMLSRIYQHIGEKSDYLQQQVDKAG